MIHIRWSEVPESRCNAWYAELPHPEERRRCRCRHRDGSVCAVVYLSTKDQHLPHQSGGGGGAGGPENRSLFANEKTSRDKGEEGDERKEETKR